MKSRKFVTATVLVSSILIVCASLPVAVSRYKQGFFNSVSWRADKRDCDCGQPPIERWKMADDVMYHVIRNGMTKKQVSAILGGPDGVDDAESHFFYTLSSSSHDSLVIEFSPSGTVETVRRSGREDSD